MNALRAVLVIVPMAVLMALPMTAVLGAAGADPVDAFALPDLDGRPHTLGQYRGKWVIINYWATNCAPCLKEIPELEQFYSRHKDSDAVVLGVNYEDIKLSWLKDFIASVRMTYPVLRAEPDSGTPFGPIKILPTTVIVSPQGQLMGVQHGAVTAKMIDDYIHGHGTVSAKSTGDAGS